MTSVSKRKGNGFENDTAKKLNQIFGITSFSRTPGSGAWMGRTNAQKRSGVAAEAQETLRGDLITPLDFPFVVECKINATSPSYNQILADSDAKLDSWLKEVEYDAEQANKAPMLIFKTPRKGTYVATPKMCFPGETIDDIKGNYLIYHGYVIMSLDNFEQNKKLFYTPPVENTPQ